MLKPKTTEQVSEILKYCNKHDIAVCVQGGNTGLVGGSVPVFDEVILSTSAMNKIISFDKLSGKNINFIWKLSIKYHWNSITDTDLVYTQQTSFPFDMHTENMFIFQYVLNIFFIYVLITSVYVFHINVYDKKMYYLLIHVMNVANKASKRSGLLVNSISSNDRDETAND